ncbi:hypothetical protein [Brumimicrobium oceani]|uniref:DUF3081 domain-containing protein n=1 Tax=Brumimicrobium oceani TaxID=2100725 RepID=A0A2U2XFA4_9FLAO|nr:hypothetical protein [Brumimicrobium oceani]PWH86482.1 hypothetical protein DIT68_04390 [Brumimicrobium oceani]
MKQDSKKQTELLKSIENFIITSNLTFRVEDDKGDYLFYLTSKSGLPFTFDVCDGYVEFYGDKSHDLINYYDSDFIEKTLKMIQSYLE